MGGNVSVAAQTDGADARAPRARWQDWLRCGQALEARGELGDALHAYDACLALTRTPANRRGTTERLGEALGWMNRGNALQRFGEREAVAVAVAAYDHAIAAFGALSTTPGPGLRNRLGAAWTNRGRALQLFRTAANLRAAVASHTKAIALLSGLPLTGATAHRRNLAGAWLNLADAQLGLGTRRDLEASGEAACTAAALSLPLAAADLEFAELALKAQRVRIDAVGRLLAGPALAVDASHALAAEAGDAIDDGLALARHWDARGIRALRPLALRLFRFGAQFYRQYQTHFLPEFLRENLPLPADDACAFADDPAFLEVAATAISSARSSLRGPQVLVVGDAASERLVALSHELDDLARHVAHLQKDLCPL